MIYQTVVYTTKIGAMIGAIYGFEKSIDNMRWSSFTNQLGNVIVNVFIMGLGGGVIGLLFPVSFGVVMHRCICRML